jgi:3-(3-hydroxy-phenyl)propionate hydroxylase
VCKLDRAEALARDARFRAAERERNGPVAMTDVVPPLRAGMIDPESGGQRLPEFVVQGGEAGERHLDMLLAGRFTLITRDELPAVPVIWKLLDGQIVRLGSGGCEDADGRLDAWLAEREARWAIVRPDRYIFATGADDPALDAALALLESQLNPGVVRRTNPISLEASAS